MTERLQKGNSVTQQLNGKGLCFLVVSKPFYDDRLNQVCFKFRKEVIPTIDWATLPFLQKCQNSLPNDALVFEDMFKAPPHLIIEQHAILKIMFAFLYQIASTECTEVLISPTNASSLELVLRTMGEGAVLVSDPIMKKTCIQFYRELIRQWMSKDCAITEVVRIRSGFAQYASKDFLTENGQLFCKRRLQCTRCKSI